MSKKITEEFYPTSRAHWRKWLQKNHAKKQSVWLICYKIKSGKPSISWSDAVEEALCFGWIDSTRRPIDEERFMQFFTQRKASSTWSKVNKEKIERLIADGSMSNAGLKIIELAKQNGSWSVLDEVEADVIPKGLEKAFRSRKGSKQFFMSLSKSVRKQMLQWIVLAKQQETKQKRINEIAECAGQKLKPKQFS